MTNLTKALPHIAAFAFPRFPRLALPRLRPLAALEGLSRHYGDAAATAYLPAAGARPVRSRPLSADGLDGRHPDW